MTRRGRLALALGLGAYLVAWAFGSKAVYPVAIGLVLAAVLAWAWMRLARQPLSLCRTTLGRDYFEGDDVDVSLEVELGPGLLPPGLVVLHEQLAKLGERRTSLRGRGSRVRGRYVLERVPRGRYTLEHAQAVLQDPFGLVRTEASLPPSGAATLVYPRLVRLDTLFSDAGRTLPEGRRLLLRRPSGYDVHSVREHQQGESLRHVHWRTTAKRARLMVKELEDAPRDEMAVVLDAEAGNGAGESFDVQVRVAGSIVLAHTRRSRRAVLVVNSAVTRIVPAGSSEGDRHRLLEVLAAAEPEGRSPVEALLADEGSPVVRALELVVVTARLTPGLIHGLVQRSLADRHASLVYVDAASFGRGLPAPRAREPGLLRLQAAGIPVAVVRRGDDLAAVLSSRALEEAAHG